MILNPEDLKAVETWRSSQNAYPNWIWRADTQLVSGDIKLKLDGISVSDVSGLEEKAETHRKVEEPTERAIEENLSEDAHPMKTEAGNTDETETDQNETQATVIEEVEEAEVQPEEASLRDKAEDAIGKDIGIEEIGSVSREDEQST